MAKQTHDAKGIVVYIDLCQASAKLAEFVDMHLQVDIEDWSTRMLDTLADCSFLSIGQIQDRARINGKASLEIHYSSLLVAAYQPSIPHHVGEHPGNEFICGTASG